MPPPPSNAKLKVELEVIPKTGATSAAMKQLEEQARRVGNAARSSRTAPSSSQSASPSMGSEEGIGFLGKLAAASFLAERSLQALTSAIRIFTQEHKTASQKVAEYSQSLLESIPLVGGFAAFGRDLAAEVKYGSSLRQFGRTQERIGMESSVDGITAQRNSALDQIGSLRSSARARSLATGLFDRGFDIRNPLARNGIGFSRGGVGDYFAQGINNFANLYGGLPGIFQTDAMRAANRQVTGAQENLFVAQSELSDIQERRRSQAEEVERLRSATGSARLSGDPARERQMRELYERMRRRIPFLPKAGASEFGEESNGQPVKEMEGMVERNRKLNDLKAAEARLQATVNAELNKSKEVEQRRLELARNRINVNKAELDFLKSKESRIMQGREALSSMTELERYNLLQATRDLNQRGWENLPQDVQQMLLANPATADFARNRRPDIAQDPFFRELNNELGGALDLRPVQDRREELERKIEKQLDESVVVFNKGIEKVTEAFASAMEKLAKQIADTEIRILENQQRLQGTQKQLQ